jgi:hypothetical protein
MTPAGARIRDGLALRQAVDKGVNEVLIQCPRNLWMRDDPGLGLGETAGGVVQVP